tara:strand:+ start:1340 stop:2371 length:1032 start_codon:yes stop_codon:yes gene_type:complete
MLVSSSEIYINGERVDYSAGTLLKEGGNTASRLSFTIPGDDVTYRKYWAKEVTFFFDKSDAYPMFRGFIINAEINENYSVSFRAVDVLGFLTGINRASIVLDEKRNIDGLTIAGALKKMIGLSSLTKIGTDYLNDTDPIKKISRVRNRVFVLDTITKELGELYNTTDVDLPRQNIIKVVDDGTTGQLVFELLKNVDNSIPSYIFTYDDNIINFEVQNRKIPTIITVKGKGGHSALFSHTGAMAAYGEHFMNVSNPNLKSRAECMDFAQKVFNANLKAKYEYNLTTFEGAYLEENDVIKIIDDSTEVEGNFRIVGKTINFGPGAYEITLTINQQPPLISQFLVT